MALTVSLPDSLKTFIDEQVSSRGYGDSSDYVSDLVREAAREREQLATLKAMLIEGRDSGPGEPVDAAYFERRRTMVRSAGRSAE
jgi:antitoxin ParD1/3/4